MQEYIDIAMPYLTRVALAIIILIVGWWFCNLIAMFAKRAMKNIEPSLKSFLGSIISVLLKIILIITVASMFGIEMTSFIAVLAAASFAVGLALQGSLSNFAGGVLIILFKPFKVGDYIEGAGLAGTVNKIQIFSTILKTPDNKTVIIPNGTLSNSSITNFSVEPTRRVDMQFSISYKDDISKAKKVIVSVLEKDKRIIDDVFVKVGELAESSVNIRVRVWCKREDYWNIYFETLEKVKNEFDKKGITIPFPQVHVHT